MPPSAMLSTLSSASNLKPPHMCQHDTFELILPSAFECGSKAAAALLPPLQAHTAGSPGVRIFAQSVWVPAAEGGYCRMVSASLVQQGLTSIPGELLCLLAWLQRGQRGRRMCKLWR